MIGVVILSRKYHINPDNVAIPIAASLGDITTLALLAGSGSLLFSGTGMSRVYSWYSVSGILPVKMEMHARLADPQNLAATRASVNT